MRSLKVLLYTVGLVSFMFLFACSTPTQPSSTSTANTLPTSTQPAQTNVTVTPTSSLLRRDDRDKIKSLFANPPSTLGGIPYEAYLNQSFSEPIAVSITNMGDTKYPIIIWFESSLQEAQRRTQGVTSRLPKAQRIEIGDEAYVAGDAWKQGAIYLAVLRYRNVVVEIESPLRPATMTTVPHPLTNDQLAAVLKDIYEKILKKVFRKTSRVFQCVLKSCS